MIDFQQAGGLEDWRILNRGASAWFNAPSLTAGAALISRIADLTAGNTLPDLDLRPTGVRVRIGAPRSVTLTEADVALARTISAAAQSLGLTADPAALQTVHLTIDAADQPSVASFWQTALAYESSGDSLEDPLRRDPTIRFRPQDPPRPLRNRIHVDIGRPSEAVDAVRTKIAQDPYGAFQLTLADPDGNEVDLVPADQLTKTPETADWQTLFGAMTHYPTASPAQASELATTIAALVDEAGLPILVDLRPAGITIDSGKDQWEDNEGAAEPRFAALATQIQAAARNLDLAADPTSLRFAQLGIDAVDVPAVQTFWRTVLGYEHDPRPFLTDIYDPRRLNPVIMFQQMDPADEERRQQRNRINLALHIPGDQSNPRIATALAAGGKLLSNTPPNTCTIADPETNELTLHWH